MSNKIKTYKQFLESNLHPSSLPIFTYTGVNYGDPDHVSTHFGDKNGNKKPNAMSHQQGFTLSDSGEFYSEEEIKDLIRRYYIWCKQNGEDPIPLEDLSGKTIAYIENKLKEE